MSAEVVSRENSRTASQIGFLAGLAIVVLAFGLRIYHLDAQSVWLDEGLSITFGRLPIDQLLPKIVEADIHPPLYILSLHFWMGLAGESEFAVRFLSLAFGVLLIPASYRLALTLFDGKQLTAVAASLLAAVSPFQLYYSQEARNYIVVTLWGLLSFLCLWQALHRPGRNRRWWFGYSLFTALALYTHYYGGFLVLSQALYLLFTWGIHRQLVARWVAAIATSGLLYLPWAPGLLAQFTNLWFHPDYWPGTLDLWAIISRMFASFSLGGPQGGPILLALGLLFAIGIAFLIRRGGLRGKAPDLYLILYLIVPLLVVYAISARNPKFAERYLLLISPAFYLLLSRALTSAFALRAKSQLGQAGKAFSIAALAIFVMASSWGIYQVYYSPAFAKDDHRGAIGYIQDHSQPGDVILLVRNTYQSFVYYYRGDLPWYGLDPGSYFEPAAGRLKEITTGKRRIWVLLWQDHVVDPTAIVTGLLRDRAIEVPIPVSFTGVGLKLFELGPEVYFDTKPSHSISATFSGAPPIASPTPVGIASGALDLLGYDQNLERADAGQKVRLAFYWLARRPIEEDLNLRLEIRDREGWVWGSTDQRLAGYFLPTSRWPTGTVVRGQIEVTVDNGAPPGNYNWALTVYSASSLRVWAATQGERLSTNFLFGQIAVERPPTPPTIQSLAIAQKREASFMPTDSATPSLRLIGTGPLPVAMNPGQSVPIALFWEGLMQRPIDYEAKISLLDSANRLLAESRGPLVPSYPTSRWMLGDRLKGQISFTAPADAAEGTYQLVLTVQPQGGSGQALRAEGKDARDGQVLLGSLVVKGRERLFAQPSIEQKQRAQLEDKVIFLGYDFSSKRTASEWIGSFTLYWLAQARMDTSYKVFVHILDRSGNLIGQADAVPGRWAWPTNSWQPGEYLVDSGYEIIVPLEQAARGGLIAIVGMYDSQTGQRLKVSDDGSASLDDKITLKGLKAKDSLFSD